MMFVYAMMDIEGDVKIGYSATPYKRAEYIQWKTKRIIVVTIPVDCGDSVAHRIENICHCLFNKQAIGGEWFKITIQEAVDTIKQVIIDIDGAPETNSLITLEHMHYRKIMREGTVYEPFNKKEFIIKRISI